MINYDKAKIKEQITVENNFELLQDFGGNPIYTSFGIISDTICHNEPGEGSKKLYYYTNTGLYHCYTGCAEPSFDIFQLIIKVFKIQKNKDIDLNEAVRYAASRFGCNGVETFEDDYDLFDWKVIQLHEQIRNNQTEYTPTEIIKLKNYDDRILKNLYYGTITPWLKDNITKDVTTKAKIGYYAGEAQITIPHFDDEGNFVGLRGRSLIEEDCERFGKYRPVKINNVLYNHPLGLNLYGLNWNKNNIKVFGKAIVAESEKSCLQYASYFGWENNICVACCGSSFSSYQCELLLRLGVKEIIIGFDRQFQENNKNDVEFLHLKNNLLKIKEKYGKYALISFIFDKNKITPYKSSPLDNGKDIFLKLYKERIVI